MSQQYVLSQYAFGWTPATVWRCLALLSLSAYSGETTTYQLEVNTIGKWHCSPRTTINVANDPAMNGNASTSRNHAENELLALDKWKSVWGNNQYWVNSFLGKEHLQCVFCLFLRKGKRPYRCRNCILFVIRIMAQQCFVCGCLVE